MSNKKTTKKSNQANNYTKDVFIKPPKLPEETKKKLKQTLTRKVGNNRKNKYEYWLTDDGLLLISGWSRNGMDQKQIARKIGIAHSTLSEWKMKYQEIGEALKNTAELADLQVENALWKKATGYRVILNQGGKQVEQYIAPDIAAQIFWLTNRKPDKWTNTQAKKVQLQDPVSTALLTIAEQVSQKKPEPINLSKDLADLKEYKTTKESV